MALDTLEFRSPIANVEFSNGRKLALLFDQVWQRRLQSLWDFLGLQNDIGNLLIYSNLPVAPLVGQRAWISDSTTNVWGAVPAGGGANQVGVVFNGISWTVFAK